MNLQFAKIARTAALGLTALASMTLAQAQTPAAAPTPKPTADPYANNADAGKLQFPLAAPAGKDSGALTKALPGGVNQSSVDPATWKYGPAWDAPPNSQIWNPVKLKLMRGEKVTGGTLFSSTDPATYCAMADSGYDFIWT